MAVVPGSNPSGNDMAVPNVGTTPTPAIGGVSNPLTPTYPSGTTMPPMTSSAATPAPVPGTTDPNALPANPALAGLNPNTSLGSSWVNQNDFIKAFKKAGYSAGDAAMLWSFLQGGAGYNPQVAQAMLASLQPGVERGQANIMEQFSAEGLRNSSPASIGLGDFNSQVTLDEGQILAGMYQQAVQNYLQVILAGKEPSKNSAGGIGALVGGGGQAASGIGSLISSLSAGGGAGGIGALVGGGAAAGGSAGAAAGDAAIAALAL